jgi:hypothetical protein
VAWVWCFQTNEKLLFNNTFAKICDLVGLLS